MTEIPKIADTSDREIVLSRLLDAPRERVWDAMTKPEQLDAWWGPNGFRNVTYEFDLRPGGVWRHAMVGPDGALYPNVTRWEEIVPPERLVYTNGGAKVGGPGTHFRCTWTLVAKGDKTELTGRMVFETPEERDLVIREFGAIEGGKQTLARLAERLDKPPAFELVMERVFDAPRDRVFAAWTTAESLSKWFAPHPYQLVVREFDFRPGGRFVMAMRGPDGGDFLFHGIYRTIVAPTRLVWTGEFDEGPADQMTTDLVFSEEKGKTRLFVRQTFHVSTATIEHATKGAHAGWTKTLDQLASLVS